MWNTATGDCNMVFDGHSGWVLCLLEFGDGTFASGDSKGGLMIWDPSHPTKKGREGKPDRKGRAHAESTGGRCRRVLHGHSGDITRMARVHSPASDIAFMSSSLDGTVILWE